MDEKEKEKELTDERSEDFSLDDLLKEFAPEESEEETAAELDEDEDVRMWRGSDPGRPVTVTAAQETMRLDELFEAMRTERTRKNMAQPANLEQTQRFAPITDDTVVFQPVSEEPKEDVSGDTVAFAPVAGAEPETEKKPVYHPNYPPKAEPYSEDWQPEFEEPIRDYVPPEPIVFRPKSRFRELKRKLVAGPERRYYELSELGLGKVQLAIFFNLLVALLSAGATALYAFDMVIPSRLKLMIFGQFLSLLLSALLGSYQLIEGVADMVKLRFSMNSLLVFSLIACLADGVLCLQSLRVPCCAAFSLHMTMSLWSTYHKRNTEMGQMDTMRKAIRLNSVVKKEDFYEGRPGFLRGEGEVEHFMDTYAQPSGMEKTLSVYALVALAVSLGIGITAGVMHNVELGLQVFATSLLVAIPVTGHIAVSRPMAILERRLHKLGAVICGWQGIKKLSGEGVFPVKDEDLFPAGSVKLNGLKFYGSRDPDEVVAYATALISGCGGVMSPLFNQLLDSRSAHHYEAENIRSYPNGGVGGEVNGEAVLAGTLAFMRSMGVDMPGGTKVNQAVYVAIDGSLSGVFAVAYTKVKDSALGITTLSSYRKLTPVIIASDFMLTEGFLRGKFGISTRRMAFPDRDIRCSLSSVAVDEKDEVLALTTYEGFAGAAYAVTGSRAVRGAAIRGTVITMLSGILGLGMMLILGITGAHHLLTPGNVLLYELLWMLPGLLITEGTRSV